MAEFEGIEGVLGEDPEREGEGAAGADMVALALALQKAGHDPALSRRLGRYLIGQKRLVDLQIKHFDEERRLGIAAAKRKRYTDYIRNGLYTCIALLVLGILIAVVRMTFEAMIDHSLVVEDFTVPADFAARGISSQALAEDLASRVAAIGTIQSRNSLGRSGEVRADQAGTLRVQIPETGISVDELERFLHHWLGHETVLNGELREEAGGQVSIVLHIAGADPMVVKGSSADLDSLMQATAEKAFATSEPGAYVIYLGAMGRHVEAYEAAMRLVQDAQSGGLPQDQAGSLYALLAGRDPDRRRALSSALIAIDASPRRMTSWMEAVSASAELGHDQAAVDFGRRMLGTRRQDQFPVQQDSYAWTMARERVFIDLATGNYAALGGDYQVADQRPNSTLAIRYAESAATAALLHDVARSRHDLALALAAEPLESAALGTLWDGSSVGTRWDVSSSAGDWPQALAAAKALVAAAEAQKAAAPNPEFAIPAELLLATQYRPLLAIAEAMTGDTDSATALISQSPTDCYLCVRTRARVAAAAGDAAMADRWFAEAVRQAPGLPMAYFEWGRALLARGDLAGATREFSLAHEKGPHFADPLKGWGDVLVKQEHPQAALAKYDEALRNAPHWPVLHAARAAAYNAAHALSLAAAAHIGAGAGGLACASVASAPRRFAVRTNECPGG